MTANTMMDLIREMYPFPRSMTGNGVRRTLEALSEWLPLDVTETPTGSKILDWSVPKEWNVREAWIRGPDGAKVVDFADSNLHLVAYSHPIRETMPLERLQTHLHSLPDLPDAVPYRTGYFGESWGFCISDAQRSTLQSGNYEVCVDAEISNGSLTYGEFFKAGTTDQEIMLSAHTCHPSIVNDNLTGIAVAAALGRRIKDAPPGPFGVRILFAPATVGSIAWLAANPDATDRIHAGLTLVCLGDQASLTYKQSAGGNARIDRVASSVIGQLGGKTVDFYPFGYDERQFNSPGYRIPFGSLMRSRHGTFPEYHNSLDNPDFVTDESLVESLEAVSRVVEQMQTDVRFLNQAPFGEPQLGSRGLYTSVQNAALPKDLQYAVLWLLNLSDGDHGLTEISDESGMDPATLTAAADVLVHHHLLKRIEDA